MRSAGLVLAGGSSRRLGRPKQLVSVGGEPLLQRVVGEACRSSLDEVWVILGAHAEEIRAGVDLGRAQVVVNERHESGMASSLRAGLAALDAGVERVVVILGDQPDLEAGVVDALLELQLRGGRPAAALSFDGLLHPPVVMARELWGGLESLEGDIGCRAILRARPELVAALPAPGGGRHPMDVDTPEDLERVRAALSGHGAETRGPA
ncbi:MAG: nucleotidyltransferase family protein [Candidatus Dormibacterales bacterium]